jgi:nitrite reductase (NO-forming)
MEETQEEKKGYAKRPLWQWITVYLVIAVVLYGAFYYFVLAKKGENNQAGQYQTEQASPSPTAEGKMEKMEGATPPIITEEQQEQLTAGTDTSSKKKTFDIAAGGFYYVPNKITVNKGDTVTFNMKIAGGTHDLVIDELDVNIPVIEEAGGTGSVTFTADKVGSFVYYCSLPGHREKGMWGTLVVE